jgi:hypothetical protein
MPTLPINRACAPALLRQPCLREERRGDADGPVFDRFWFISLSETAIRPLSLCGIRYSNKSSRSEPVSVKM